jgi:spore coat polysaccharide biosynthesis protein SpsF
MIDSKPIGFITVRTSSTRLPNKCMLPLGDETVISHVVKRAISYGIEPIICTSTDKSDDILEEISKELGVKCFRGSLVNKLKRWLDCAEHFNVNSFHTIDADDPLFDGHEMIASLDLLSSKDCDVVCPTESSSAGGASVGYSLTTAIIKKALENLDADTDTEMMWYYLEKVGQIKMINLPETTNNNSKVRLTLDYEEDYWLLASIVRILGDNPSRNEVMQLLLKNPDLAKINLFRNDEWKAAQLSKQL